MSYANTFLYNLKNKKKNIVLNQNTQQGNFYRYLGGNSILYRNLYIENQNMLDYYGHIYENDTTLFLESEFINLSGIVNISNGLDIDNNIYSDILSYDSTNKKIGYNSQSYVTLIDEPLINWDVRGLINNAIVTLTDNRILNLTNAINGTCGTLIITQDSIGGRTLTLPTNSKVINNGSGIVILSSIPDSIDILTFTYNGTYYFWNYGKNYT